MTPNWASAGQDDTYRYETTTLSVFWPRAEYEKLIAQWPHLAAEVGTTWDEHRQQLTGYRPRRTGTVAKTEPAVHRRRPATT